MTRRSFRLIGGEGTFDIEAEQHPDGHIEVAEVNDRGVQQHPVFICHTWVGARAYAGKLAEQAIIDERVG